MRGLGWDRHQIGSFEGRVGFFQSEKEKKKAILGRDVNKSIRQGKFRKCSGWALKGVFVVEGRQREKNNMEVS